MGCCQGETMSWVDSRKCMIWCSKNTNEIWHYLEMIWYVALTNAWYDARKNINEIQFVLNTVFSVQKLRTTNNSYFLVSPQSMLHHSTTETTNWTYKTDCLYAVTTADVKILHVLINPVLTCTKNFSRNKTVLNEISHNCSDKEAPHAIKPSPVHALFPHQDHLRPKPVSSAAPTQPWRKP